MHKNYLSCNFPEYVKVRMSKIETSTMNDFA